jgi:hypothetical protein
LAGFIVGGMPLTTQMTTGRYELRYSSGRECIDEANYFGADTVFSKADSPLSFSVQGSRMVGISVELILQKDGNLSKSNMNKGDF